jgi:hypothetical protein
MKEAIVLTGIGIIILYVGIFIGAWWTHRAYAVRALKEEGYEEEDALVTPPASSKIIRNFQIVQ